MTPEIQDILQAAKTVLIIQADNPDADSLASSLAMEQILHDMGKEPVMYCGIDMPDYLKYLPGWDRVEKDIPSSFDASIIVDTSAKSLLGKLQESGHQGWVAAKPVIIIDHHAGVECDIPFATVVHNDSNAVSTGQAIYALGKHFDWPLSVPTLEYIATSILADSMGLTSEATNAGTYRVMAELVDGGVDRPKLEEARRALNKMPPVILRYKGRLIERAELADEGRIALVTIPQNEINDYSPLYNPAPLIQGDLLMTKGVYVSVVLKSYDTGRITAAIRCNPPANIAASLAEHFGGGGHSLAAGFKLEGGRPLQEVKSECLQKATELLSSLTLEDPADETIQYTFS